MIWAIGDLCDKGHLAKSDVPQTNPKWNQSMFNAYTKTLDAFAQHDNLFAVYIGNEIVRNCRCYHVDLKERSPTKQMLGANISVSLKRLRHTSEQLQGISKPTETLNAIARSLLAMRRRISTSPRP